jgi:4-hydroxy-tetrahydrodipicolinate synthase
MSLYDDVRRRVRGLALNLPTPFQGPDYYIDEAGLRSNIERYVAADVPIILLTYGTSEFYVLSDDEIARVTRIVVEAAARRALVVAATGRWWLGQTVAFARFCEEIGADCLMLTKMLPAYFRSNADVVEFHREVAGRTRIPLMFHNELDGPASVELAEKVAEVEHVVAMKQESPNYDQYVDLAQRVAGRIAVVAGAGAPLAHWAHQFGATASLTGVGQWAPRAERRYVEQMLSGQAEAGRRHLDTILPYRLLARRLGNHACIKHAMSVAGLAGGPCRPPSQNLTGEQKAQLTPVVLRTLESLGETP